MAYQQDDPAWVQMQLQAAAQYQQQMTGFINPQQPQVQHSLIPQPGQQQMTPNVFNSLPLQQQQYFDQQLQDSQQFRPQQTRQPPTPYMAQHSPRQPVPQWNTPPPSQYQAFQRPPPVSQRPPLNQFGNTNNSPWNNSVPNSRSDSYDRSKSNTETPDEPSLMDYDFGHMGAAAKSFSSEITKDKESQAIYDGTDGMEHDGIQTSRIPDSDPYRRVRKTICLVALGLPHYNSIFGGALILCQSQF